MAVKEGKILAFHGQFGSGLAIMTVMGLDGEMATVYCENGPTVRALEDAFGPGVINPLEHTFNERAIVGKRIKYSAPGGLLEGFDPIDEQEGAV